MQDDQQGGEDVGSEILILAPPEAIKPETIEISEKLFAEAFCDDELKQTKEVKSC